MRDKICVQSVTNRTPKTTDINTHVTQNEIAGLTRFLDLIFRKDLGTQEKGNGSVVNDEDKFYAQFLFHLRLNKFPYCGF